MVMRLFKKEEKPKLTPQRLQKIDTPSLYNWLETSIMGLGATFDQVRYHDLGNAQFQEQLDAINMLWDEITKRVDKS